MSGRTQIERAIIQIQEKPVVPEIDFTQHQLENGYTISTQERVVKEVCSWSLPNASAVLMRSPDGVWPSAG